MISEYDLMRLSETADSEGFSQEDVPDMVTEKGVIKSGDVTIKPKKKKNDDRAKYLREKEKYLAFYDDLKFTPKDDW